MSTMKQYIREYVRQKNTITLDELVNRLYTEKNIQTSYGSIKTTLYVVRKELYIEPPLSEAERLIRNYVKRYNNSVTFEQVKNYILKKKHIKLKEKTICQILRKVLKESKGKLKRDSIRQILLQYVESKDYIVTFTEAKEYLLKVKKKKVPDSTIRNTMYFIRKELGIEFKSITLKQVITEYVQEHQGEVTLKELKNYVLNEQQIKVADSTIRIIGREVLAETGRTFTKITVAGLIRDYLKTHNGEVTMRQIKSYIFNETDIKTSNKTIEGTFYRVRGELIEKGIIPHR